jgi:hypothetical protein
MAAREDAWVGVVFAGGPLGYGIVYDTSIPFCGRKTYTVISFYAPPGQPEATQALVTAFEEWARDKGISHYVVTTRRDTGASIKCFSSKRYGFRKAFFAFEKIL